MTRLRTLAALALLPALVAASPVPGGDVRAAAQVSMAPPAPAPELTDAEIAVLDPAAFATRFRYDRDRRMMLDVTIDGSGPWPFVVDTGSEATLVAREVARRLALPQRGSVMLSTLSGRTRTDTFAIAALDTPHGPLRDLATPALGAADLGAAGLLGVDSLAGRRVVIDFRDRSMVVRPSKRNERPVVRDADTITVTARSRTGRLILSDATLGNRRVRLIVDTGAQTSIGNLPLARLVQQQQARKGPLRATQILSVTGGIVPGQRAVISRLRIGPSSDIADMPITFADAHAFRALGLDRTPAMLLGMDALQLYDRVEIDFTNRRVVFDMPDDGVRTEGRRANACVDHALSSPVPASCG